LSELNANGRKSQPITKLSPSSAITFSTLFGCSIPLKFDKNRDILLLALSGLSKIIQPDSSVKLPWTHLRRTLALTCFHTNASKIPESSSLTNRTMTHEMRAIPVIDRKWYEPVVMYSENVNMQIPEIITKPLRTFVSQNAKLAHFHTNVF